MSRNQVTDEYIDKLYEDAQITDFERNILHLIKAAKERGAFDNPPEPDALRVVFVGRVEKERGGFKPSPSQIQRGGLCA
jgi:hypothetical protein